MTLGVPTCARSCWRWVRSCRRCCAASFIGAGASALGEAIELYQACVAFVCDSQGDDWGDGEKGTITVEPSPQGDDWGDGEKGTITVEPSPQGDDWGDGEKGTITVEPSPQGDDWGDGEKGTITVEPSPQGDDGIDWGDGEGQEGTITVVEAGTEAPEGVARGSDALTLLENPETRNQFIDELMELELFLAQRLLELEDEVPESAPKKLPTDTKIVLEHSLNSP
ncbi:PREDICTED: CDK5 regulatory subunit-associated protein 3 [Corvus brachyrhynchos]|uniref:CDK5 regulatory subunit-associated protein 3 n=1 Tax=Corvus brachyrhynchos TaxID=85066 RepID=UPI000816546D|nr:PREDICTED: CDK5 regulatory subunit-associated protein 3 [Corvus brachyrhynchos]